MTKTIHKGKRKAVKAAAHKAAGRSAFRRREAYYV